MHAGLDFKMPWPRFEPNEDLTLYNYKFIRLDFTSPVKNAVIKRMFN